MLRATGSPSVAGKRAIIGPEVYFLLIDQLKARMGVCRTAKIRSANFSQRRLSGRLLFPKAKTSPVRCGLKRSATRLD